MGAAGRKIFIAGHCGFVGSVLVRYFSDDGRVELITAGHRELDLINQRAVEDFLASTHPDIVICAAGRVGGIHTNSRYPAEFIYENLMMATNIIHAAWKVGVKRLLHFGSACIYPKVCVQPMTPDLLMTGSIEPTNAPYALAKLAGLSLCHSYNRQYGTTYMTAIPSNLYGPGDTFDLDRAHVVSALIRRFHEAKVERLAEVTLWGSGQVRRDFLYVDDIAKACDILLQQYTDDSPINIGSGTSTSVRELAAMVAQVVGYHGDIRWDTAHPDGAPERFLDTTPIQAMGWRPRVSLMEGLQRTYDGYLQWRDQHQAPIRSATCASL